MVIFIDGIDVKRALVLILIIVVFTLPNMRSLLTPSLTIKSSGTVSYISPLSPLHIEGKYFKNELGNTVILRGVNFATFLDSAVGVWPLSMNPEVWDEDLVRTNLEKMKEWGINSIRLLLWANWWIDDANETVYWGDADLHYRTAIKKMIELAGEYGIYIIISFWGVVAGPGNYESFPIPPYSKTDSQPIFPTAQSWIDFWVDVATELGGYSNVLFDIWNEPFNGASDGISIWFNTTQQAINAIRGIPRDNIIFVQWAYCSGVQWLRRGDLPVGNNVAYSQHIYRFHGSIYNNGYTYDQVYNALYYNQPDNWRGDYGYAVENNIPLWIGEMGCWMSASPAPEELEYWKNTLKILNEWGMGYSAWDWRIGWGWSMINSDLSPTMAGQILIKAIAT